MLKPHVAGGVLCAALAGIALAQAPATVDFSRDIAPLFRQNCIGCHGPLQQMNGLRLDRRSSVFRNGARRVVPGSSENSFLYHRLIGTEYGLQMPPTGALRTEQVSLVKNWIDQGAEWPDSLANEADFAPVNPKAVAAVEVLRAGGRRAFLRAVADDAKLLNARGPEGSTPFMYAVLYSDAALLEQLLKKGADVNARSDSKATALMWAASDLAKTRVLLEHGADLNARSEEGRTPLMIAAGHPGGSSIVKLLLEHGANPNPTKNPDGESSPLIQAAVGGDAESMRLLLDHGADVKASAGPALVNSIAMDCRKCVDLLAKGGFPKEGATFVLLQIAAFGDTGSIRWTLDHGADVNAYDPLGHTALMYAAGSDLLPVEAVKLLIERGANVNLKSMHKRSGDSGTTALEMAQLHGETPVVTLLKTAGATGSGGHAVPDLQPRRAGSIQSAIERSLPLLQRGDASFTAKSGCISCHNDSLAAMTVGLARKKGIRVDEELSARQVKANVAYLEQRRDELHQSYFSAQAGSEVGADLFGPGLLAYVLEGLDAERYKPDLSTDAVVMYLKAHQTSDGSWPYPAGDTRPPICEDHVGQTARAMRALQLYAPKGNAEYEKAIQLAARWLVKSEPRTNEDRISRLLGLAWASVDKDATAKASREVLALQRTDGGWSDFPALESNAYTTGQALVALRTAGLAVSDPAYKRGVEFLLNTQMEDGSWYVKTRALAFQPYFDNGFPYGVDQFISSAGTGWASMALAETVEAPVTRAGR